MSSPYRKIYPPTESILFDGGLNNKFERSLIEDNESPDCLNVIFSAGAVETRQGVAKFNTTSVGSFVGDGLYTRRARDSSETMVAFWGGHAFELTGTSTFTTIPSAQSLFTAGVRFGADQAENYLFAGNGGQIPYKWNGAEFTRHGVYPPTTTSTVASQAAGVLTGDYRYKVTWVNSNLVESDVGPVTATFTAAGATLRVSSIPTAAVSYGVNSRRLYRTIAGGAEFKRVATISDNSTTTYDDNTADASLGATAPTDNGVPPKYNAIFYHEGRLFMNDTANPNLVWWTELDNPYTVASTNFKAVGNNTSDLVVGFGKLDGNLVVICERSVTIGFMPGTDDSQWTWKVTNSPYGTKSPYCVLNVNGSPMFAATEDGNFVGFAQLEGNALKPSSTLLTVAAPGSDRLSDKIEQEMVNVQRGYLSNISGIVYKNKAYIAVTHGASQTQNNRYYLFDFSMGNLKKNQRFAWSPNNGVKPAQFTVYGGNLYYQAADAVGRVYKMESGTYGDDGSAIDSYYWTKELTGYQEDTNFQKDFRYANFLVENSGAWFMDLVYRVDSDQGGGNVQQVSVNPGGSLWGTMVWGRDSWGGGTAQKEYRQQLGTSRGKRIQFKFTNQNKVNQKFKVYRMNFAYNVKGFR